MSITAHGRTGGDTGAMGRLPMLASSLAALLYPFALEGFNTSVTRIAAGAYTLSWLSAAACLALAFAMPSRRDHDPGGLPPWPASLGGLRPAMAADRAIRGSPDASRTGLPAYIRSAVTRCGRCASYAAITRQTPTYSFPSAAGQSAPSVSTASSSASGRPPRCHSRSTHTCFATPVGSSSRMTATTRPPSSTTSGTRTFSHRQVHRNGARPVQGLLERLTLGLGHLGAAASWRRQARDDFRFPLDHLGIRARLALGD